MAQNIFFDIGLIVIISAFLACIARLLRQPLIPAYVLAGIILGPYLGLITNLDVITNLSEIGITFLLFIVGLEIDIKKLKDVGLVASLGGLMQIAAVFAFAFIASIFMGFIGIESVYLGLTVALSSTMIVVRLLSDKRELDTLHGRIIIGILLLQDIFAIFALSILSQGSFSAYALLYSFSKGLIIIIVSLFAGKYLLPPVFKFAAASQELLFIASIATAFLFSIIINSVGFSIAIGAFIAGITLNVPYNAEIIGKIKPLRDFFSVLFFVSLGTQLSFGAISNILKQLLVFAALVIFLKPLIVMLLCSFFGYSRRTSFMTSLSLAQISEFSFILLAQGLILGHVTDRIFSLIVLMAVVTIIPTAYFINYSGRIYQKLSPFLAIFDKFLVKYKSLEYIPNKMKNFVVLCGYNRIGYSIIKSLKRMRKSHIVVDFNPETIKKLINERVPCLYGDVGDIEILKRLDMKNASIIVSTVPNKSDNLLLIQEAKKSHKKIIIFVTGSQIDEALELYSAGADYVILPHFLGGEHASLLLEAFGSDPKKLLQNKIKHVEELRKRHSMGHEHPQHHR
ncbi:cation:proton antiporter [Candidatus Woesearchaeota archaeon]|nr:cation:proton antiporter [Candidatus Woesearchaeota archaeon]